MKIYTSWILQGELRTTMGFDHSRGPSSYPVPGSIATPGLVKLQVVMEFVVDGDGAAEIHFDVTTIYR